MTEQIENYRLVEGIKSVQQHIEAGFQPFGSPTIYTGYNNVVEVRQVMVSYRRAEISKPETEAKPTIATMAKGKQ